MKGGSGILVMPLSLQDIIPYNMLSFSPGVSTRLLSPRNKMEYDGHEEISVFFGTVAHIRCATNFFRRSTLGHSKKTRSDIVL